MKDDGRDHLTLPQHIRRSLYLLPADLGNMDQSLDPFFEFDEGPEIGHIGHSSVDPLSLSISPSHLFPGVLGQLLDPEGETLVFWVDAQHNGLDLLPFLKKLGRMFDL